MTTTFSHEPDDGDDMITYLTDVVERLVRSRVDDDRDHILLHVELLDLREKWILGEMNVEDMLNDEPRPPLGIDDDPYDLHSLGGYQESANKRRYLRLLDLIRRTKMDLLNRLGDPISMENPS